MEPSFELPAQTFLESCQSLLVAQDRGLYTASGRPAGGGTTGAAATIQGLVEEQLRCLQLALVLQQQAEVVDARHSCRMVVAQLGSAWGTLQIGEDLRLQEASSECLAGPVAL